MLREYPERFLVSYGDTSWILNDGTTGRPIMGAGPSIQSYGSKKEAEEAIDKFPAGIYDRESFEIHSTHDRHEPTQRNAATADAGK